MAHKMLISLSSSFFFFLAFSPSSSLACNKEDLAALLKIRDAYPRYTFPDSWYPTDPTDDCCFWRGIRCSHRTGRIQRLTFTLNYNLSGPIPTSITGLRYLERLEFFTAPKINGSIPPELARLTRLRQLAIYNIPNLVGPVPLQLAALTKLELFNIYNTSVSGPIPSFLSQLPNLGICFFANNKFSSIPASLNLGKLTGLGLVNWRANKLSGSIPPFLFGTGTRAPSIFILTGNKLTGDIPASFSNKNFNFVYLDGNKFKGPSAKVFFSKSVSTTQLTLSNNEIAFDFSTVQFPVNLTSLDISHNKIYGSIPESITQLGSLDVSYNDLCGKIPSGGNVQQFNPDSFAHNKCLCGTPLSPCKK